VIPVYNEKDSIGQAIRDIKQEVKVPYKLYLVYDFDEDNTLPVARQVAQELGLEVIYLKNHYGNGALNAIKTGLYKTQGDYVCITMADLSDPPDVINEMMKMAQNQNADVVCASRYMKGGRQIGGPVIKSFFSKMAGLSLYYLIRFPTHDVTNSFKLYKRSLLNGIEIQSQGGFEIGMEIVVKAYQQKKIIKEVPTTWRDRSGGESRFKIFAWLSSYLRWYFLAIKASVL